MGHIVDNAVDVGSLCFLSVRSKTNTRSVSFFDYHIYHHPLRPIKTDSANVEILTARKVAVWGHIDVLVVDAGPVFLLFPYAPNQLRASLLTSPKNLKIHICFTATEGPRGPLRNCKTI